MAGAGQDQQGHHQGMDKASRGAHIFIDAVEQGRLRKQVNIEQQGAGQTQADRLGAPSGIGRQVAKQLLDQNQPEHREHGHGHEIGSERSHQRQGDGRPCEATHQHASVPCVPTRLAQEVKHKRKPECVARHIQPTRQPHPQTFGLDQGQGGYAPGPQHRRQRCRQDHLRRSLPLCLPTPLPDKAQCEHQVGEARQPLPHHHEVGVWRHGCYCAPLPVSTTPTVSNRMTRSRNREWFFT